VSGYSGYSGPGLSAGTSGYVAYWDSATTITGSSNVTYDGSTLNVIYPLLARIYMGI
jgi:hypothetical protein